MKTIFIILGFILFSVTGFSQRVVTDTLQGNETVNFMAMLDARQIQVTCTNVGGTSDGTLVLQGSTDGVNYVTLSATTGVFNFYPNDTLTIVDGAVWLINVEKPTFSYYRVVGAGTASDTTLIVINWSRR